MSNIKAISIGVAALLVIAIICGSIFFVLRFGEALAFAVTNRTQVLQEKAQWTDYVNNYGVEAPKAN